MSFRIPIQQRNTPDLRVSQQPRSAPVDVQPFDPSITKNLNSIINRQEKAAIDAQKRADQLDEARYRNALTSILNPATAKTLGAEGENAFAEAQRQREISRKQIEKLDSIQRPALREQLSIIRDQSLNTFEKTLMGHEYRQQNVVREKTFKQVAETYTNEMALSAYDPETFAQSRAELRRQVEIYARQRLGGDPDLNVAPSENTAEAIANMVLVADSSALLQTIQTLAADGDFSGAIAFANEYMADMTAEDRRKVARLVQQSQQENKTNTAKLLADEALRQFRGDPRAQRDYILANTDDAQIFNLARGILDADDALNERIEKEQNQERMARAQDAIRRGQPVSKVMSMVAPEDRTALNDYAVAVARGDKVVRNTEAYNYLDYLYNQRPEALALENIQAYAHLLPRGDIERFEARKKEVMGTPTSKITERSVRPIIDRVITTEARKTNGEIDPERAAAIRALGAETFDQVIAQLPERATQREVDIAFETAITKRIVEQETRSIFNPARWFGSKYTGDVKPLRREGFIEDQGFVNQVEISPDISPQFIEAIRNERSRNGLQTTNEDILRAIKEARRNNLDVRR